MIGETSRAEEIARKAAPLAANLHAERAGLLTLLGRTDEAIETLERAVEAGFRNVVWTRIMSDLRALHGDPRLEAILAKMQRRALPRK